MYGGGAFGGGGGFGMAGSYGGGSRAGSSYGSYGGGSTSFSSAPRSSSYYGYSHGTPGARPSSHAGVMGGISPSATASSLLGSMGPGRAGSSLGWSMLGHMGPGVSPASALASAVRGSILTTPGEARGAVSGLTTRPTPGPTTASIRARGSAGGSAGGGSSGGGGGGTVTPPSPVGGPVDSRGKGKAAGKASAGKTASGKSVLSQAVESGAGWSNTAGWAPSYSTPLTELNAKQQNTMDLVSYLNTLSSPADYNPYVGWVAAMGREPTLDSYSPEAFNARLDNMKAMGRPAPSGPLFSGVSPFDQTAWDDHLARAGQRGAHNWEMVPIPWAPGQYSSVAQVFDSYMAMQPDLAQARTMAQPYLGTAPAPRTGVEARTEPAYDVPGYTVTDENPLIQALNPGTPAPAAAPMAPSMPPKQPTAGPTQPRGRNRGITQTKK